MKLEINQKKKKQQHKNVETKQHATGQSITMNESSKNKMRNFRNIQRKLPQKQDMSKFINAAKVVLRGKFAAAQDTSKNKKNPK